MALMRSKKLERKAGGLKRKAPGLGRLDKTGAFAKPLAFIQPAPNPLAGMRESRTEDELTAEQQKLREGFIARSKAEKFRRDETTRVDYYFSIVFEHGSQSQAFLTHCGYRDPTAQFVDGMLLAKAMGIELPETPFKLKKLRPSDRSLRHLVTHTPARSELKKPPD